MQNSGFPYWDTSRVRGLTLGGTRLEMPFFVSAVSSHIRSLLVQSSKEQNLCPGFTYNRTHDRHQLHTHVIPSQI